MLPFVLLPRPLQESNVIGKGGTAGFLGAAYDPYYFYQDPNQEIKLDDLTLRKDVPKERLERRATLLKKVDDAMPDMEKAVEKYALEQLLSQGLRPGPLRPGAKCFRSERGNRQDARSLRAAYLWPGLPAGSPADRGRHALRADELAGRRQWQSHRRCLGHPRGQLRPAAQSALPETRQRPVRFARRSRPARHVEGNPGGCHRRIRPLAALGREHVRQRQRARTAAITGPIATPRWWPAPASNAARSTASRTPPDPRPPRTRCIPRKCWRRFITRWASIRTPLFSTISINRANWCRPSRSRSFWFFFCCVGLVRGPGGGGGLLAGGPTPPPRGGFFLAGLNPAGIFFLCLAWPFPLFPSPVPLFPRLPKKKITFPRGGPRAGGSPR